MMDMVHNKQHGFTLIELSIVIVIIGLLAAGILVGQDLIRAAEIRATIAQIEKYNSAVNTFRGKYGGIPGDLQYQQACAFGFYCFSTPAAGQVGGGDGNGLIQDDVGNIFNQGEIFVFWRHLSDANLIDGNFGNDSQLGGNPGGGDPVQNSDPGVDFPPAKLGRGNYIMAYGLSSDGNNYYQIQGMLNINMDTIGNLSNAMTPIEAQNIDTKLDDGLPLSGNVQAMIGGGSYIPNVAPSPIV